MRMTETLRQAFVRAVMADVPRGDAADQIKAIIDEDMRNSLPVPIVAIMKSKTLASYLGWVTMSLRYVHKDGNQTHNHYVPGGGAQVVRGYEPGVTVQAKIDKIAAADYARHVATEVMKEQLEAAVKGCQTRKQVVAMFPELERYLPAIVVPGTNLPAITNVVADLSKLGWPRGGVKA